MKKYFNQLLYNPFFIKCIIIIYLLNTTFSFGFTSLKLSYFIFFISILLVTKSDIKIFLNHSKSILLTIPFVFIFIIYAYLNNHNIFNFLKIFLFFLSFILISSVFKKYLSLKLVVEIIILASFINSTIILLEFFYDPLKVFLENILIQYSDNNISYANSIFRLRGIALGSGASLGLFNLIAMILLINNGLNKLNYYDFIKISIIFLSCFFISRSSIYVGFILYSIFLFIQFKNKPINFLFFFSLFLFVFILLFQNILAQQLDYSWFFWVFSTFETFIEFNVFEFSNSSVTDLSETTSFNVNNFILGNGYYSGPSDFLIQSDSGYWRMTNAIGMGSVLFYSYFIFNAIKINFNHKFINYLLILILLVFEIKEPFLIQNYSARALLLIFIFSYRK